MPGVERDQVLTRLGIAQTGLGETAEAKATLAQVSGPRRAVARLWAAYAENNAPAPAAATVEAAPSEAEPVVGG